MHSVEEFDPVARVVLPVGHLTQPKEAHVPVTEVYSPIGQSSHPVRVVVPLLPLGHAAHVSEPEVEVK